MRSSPARRSTVLAALLLAGCAGAPLRTVVESSGEIPIEIMKPAGAGPFPAIVILHDCSGLGPRSSGAPRRWAKELLAQGYAVAIPDSFTLRGFPNGVCSESSPDRTKVGPFRRIADAYLALERLRAQPGIDRDRIGVMGGSHGGSSTLASINDRDRQGFKAAVALYPGCDIGNPRFTARFEPSAPVLILAGELDDWTPAAPCRELAAIAHGKVELVVYPGAHHAFDSTAPVRFVGTRNNSHAPGGKGATTGGNVDAWRDSVTRVRAFFASKLANPVPGYGV